MPPDESITYVTQNIKINLFKSFTIDLLCYTIVDIHSTLYIEYYECNQMSRRKRDVIEACHNAIRANL